MNDNDIEDKLIDTYSRYVLLNFWKYYKLIFKIFFGFSTYLLPITYYIIFFTLLAKDDKLLHETSDTTLFVLLGISIIIPGLFYFTLQDTLTTQFKFLNSVYYDHNKGTKKILKNNSPFILYARSFRVERDLDNYHSIDLLDKFFEVKTTLQTEINKATNFTFFSLRITESF